MYKFASLSGVIDDKGVNPGVGGRNLSDFGMGVVGVMRFHEILLYPIMYK